MIRPFHRSDRDQLTALVNAHVAAVIPGASISVNALMSQLEREPAEYVVDPWVVDRQTFVAVERDAVVAGAHVLRYADDDRVGPGYRSRTEVRWLVAKHGEREAAAALLASVDADIADGSLPAPFVYGVPSAWPHIRALYADAGFVPTRIEVLLVADVADLPEADLQGVTRSVGAWTRLTLGERGFIELETDLTTGETLSRFAGWADIGNLVGDDATKVALLGHARAWLTLGRVDRLVTYADGDEDVALYERCGFRELVRTERGWARARS
jgi:hypothetical protein